MMRPEMVWLNPPPQAEVVSESLTVTTANQTDFWVKTFYGFTRHSGHFLHHAVTGDFTAEVTIEGQYETLYDQAGLMLRLSDTQWVKCGIEYTDGHPVFSTVVTHGQSDWSTMPLPFAADSIRLRLTRHADAIRVQVQTPQGTWIMTRLAHLPEGPAQIGIMAASPERAGFTVTFRDYTCGTAIDRGLHD
jgi:uncharacterized protein